MKYSPCFSDAGIASGIYMLRRRVASMGIENQLQIKLRQMFNRSLFYTAIASKKQCQTNRMNSYSVIQLELPIYIGGGGSLESNKASYVTFFLVQ